VTATPIRDRAQGVRLLAVIRRTVWCAGDSRLAGRLGQVEVGVVGAGLVRVQLGGTVAGDA
jgi:hypothetical protein